jgi:hypothetical protein
MVAGTFDLKSVKAALNPKKEKTGFADKIVQEAEAF